MNNSAYSYFYSNHLNPQILKTKIFASPQLQLKVLECQYVAMQIKSNPIPALSTQNLLQKHGHSCYSGKIKLNSVFIVIHSGVGVGGRGHVAPYFKKRPFQP